MSEHTVVHEAYISGLDSMQMAPSWTQQAQADAASVLMRAQTVLNFQIATALQTSLNKFMTAAEQLVALLLLCIGLERAVRVITDSDERLHLPRSVLVVQVGQSLQELLVFKDWSSSIPEGVAQGFLLNTLGLGVPSVLEILCPEFVQLIYLQNALSVWLFQYASSTRQALARVDFGVSPVLVCLCVFSVWNCVQRTAPQKHAVVEHKYLVRAMHMLLVDWLLRTIADSTLMLPTFLQATLWTMVVLVIDLLHLDKLNVLQDLRGFTIFRIAAELQRIGLLSSDAASASAGAMIVLGIHIALGAMQLNSRITSSFAEVFLVAGTSVIVQGASVGDGSAQFTLVCVICILVYQIQAALNRT